MKKKKKKFVFIIIIISSIILFAILIALQKNKNYKINNDEINELRKAKIYNNIEEMRIDKSLQENDFCVTLGYYEINDGGGAQYYIKRNTENEDKIINVILQDENLIAMQVINSKKLNVKTVGVKYGNSEYKLNNSKIVEDLIIRYKMDYDLFFPKGEVWLGNINFINAPEIFLPEISIIGEGNKTKIFTDGDDLFFDKRKKSTGIFLKAKDISIKTKDFLISNWIPKGICLGSELNDGNGGNKINIEVNFRFDNVEIAGFEYGIYSPNYSCGSSGGNDISFFMCKYGIYINDASHLLNINKVSLNYCANGINLGVGGSGNIIKNVHIATGYLGDDKDSFDEFVGIYTRGSLTIDGLYYEPYEKTAQSEKQILIDYEPFANTYGGKPLVLKDCNIGSPGWENTGIFMRVGCYLSDSPGRPNGKKESEFISLSPSNKDHYSGGILEWKESKPISVTSFKKLVSFRNKTEKLIFIGDAIKGDCIPEIYDKDYIMNKNNSIYVNTKPISFEIENNKCSFEYNTLKEYVPNHMINKDYVSQTISQLLTSTIPTKKIKMQGNITVNKLLEDKDKIEFDIYLESKNSNYKHFIGRFTSDIEEKSQNFNFIVEVPQSEIEKYKINQELTVTLYFSENSSKNLTSINKDNISINYTHSVVIN